MFERFTDRARKAMALANQEAQRLHHEYIGTEHILLGLLKEGYGVAANVLKNLNVDFARARQEVEKLARPDAGAASIGKLPQTPHARHAIELSIREARNLNHNYVGTEHLLLGLLCEQDGRGAQVLMNLGLTVEAVRQEVLSLLSSGLDQPAGAPAVVPEAATLAYLHIGRERMARLQQLAARRNQDLHHLAAEILDDWLQRQQ
jgi:ATP-dependent Clp protease ATP-binding subunit ClpC